MSKVFIIAGDIGGTNSRFALYTVDADVSEPLFYKEYSSQKAADPSIDAYGGFMKLLDLVLTESLASQSLTVADGVSIVACFACAGPVLQNCCCFTNLADGKFKVDGTAICEQFPVMKAASVVNDFVGMGYGLLTVDIEKECIVINEGADPIDETGPICCVGAGTGLGECYLTTSTGLRDGYKCFPSEGGHSDFVPRDEVQVKLLNFIQKRYGCQHRVSVERVCSGSGLVNVYDFLAAEYPDKIDPTAHKLIEAGGEVKGKFIAMNATPGSLCEQAMTIFASTYGAETGSAAVKFIPTGGIFLTGGLTPKNIKYISGTETPFMKAYVDRGRLSNLMKKIPIYAVLPEDLGIRGAYVCALKELRNGAMAIEPKDSGLNAQTLLFAGAACAVAGVFFSRLNKIK